VERKSIKPAKAQSLVLGGKFNRYAQKTHADPLLLADGGYAEGDFCLKSEVKAVATQFYQLKSSGDALQAWIQSREADLVRRREV
jgi:hypothetical protein